MAAKPVLLSGIQPSGKLNIGHYIGALRNWAQLQADFDCLFFLADLHTITVRQDPKQLREQCYDVLALYIACGINPEKNLIFCQSHVPQHAELGWVLNCFAYLGELNRMTQFKDKSRKVGQNVTVGLFDYPVLQAADILLYNTKYVPVGADQKQHVELARDIALRFNNIYGEIFTLPEPRIPSAMQGARIMSLQNPEQKMSKSDPNENNSIALLDDFDVVRKKIKRAVTDSGSEIKYAEDKIGISNLLTIYAAISGKSFAQLEADYAEAGYGKFKSDLAEAVVEFLRPIQQRYGELRGDLSGLNRILKNGAEVATARAQAMLSKVHEAVGFIKSASKN